MVDGKVDGKADGQGDGNREGLVAAYLDGSIGERDSATLLALLEDPAVADAVSCQLMLDRMMRERSRPPLDAAIVLAAVSRPGPVIDGVMARLATDAARSASADSAARSTPARSRRIVRLPRWAGVAAAAAVVATIGLSCWAWMESARPVARLMAIDPGVTVRRGDRTIHLLASEGLMPGDAVSCASQRAAFAYDDGSTVELREGTDLTFGNEDRSLGKTLNLTRGMIIAEISPQPSGRPLEVLTPHAVATVVGTRFTLLVGADPAGTRLDVEHGVVRLADRQRTSAVEVSAGRAGLVFAGAAPRLLAAQRMKTAIVASADADGSSSEPGSGSSRLLLMSAATRSEACLRFDIEVPGRIAEAVLSLQSVEGMRAGEVFVGDDRWQESTVDHGHFPAHPAQPMARFSARDGIVEVDVTAAVSNHARITLVIAGDGACASREARGAEPVITIAYDP